VLAVVVGATVVWSLWRSISSAMRPEVHSYVGGGAASGSCAVGVGHVILTLFGGMKDVMVNDKQT